MSGKKGQITEANEKLANAGLVVLGKVAEPPPPEPNVAELIARFQIDTETLIDKLRRDHQGQLVEQQRKIDQLSDSWDSLRAEFKTLRGAIDSAVHDLNEGVKEALNAQRHSARHAQEAASSVAVFDKLKASQPDFHRMVRDLDAKISRAVDATTHQGDLVRDLSVRLDELDAVAVDYEETKGSVRSIDNLVKNLDAESKTRRRTEIRG